MLLERFGQDVADLVNEVTHERRDDDKGWYFPRLHSIRGIILKFADRTSNLSRMNGVWNEKRIQKYIEKSTFWETADVLE
jgi:(p)ppGpp synthase/HD superfamily hydrolase